MVLWLLLTSDCSIIHHWIGYQVYLTYQSDLPSKSVIFPFTYLLHLLCTTFDRKDFVLFCKLIQSYLALYEVRVPQTEGLPPASFSFCVTTDTLALCYLLLLPPQSGTSSLTLTPI